MEILKAPDSLLNWISDEITVPNPYATRLAEGLIKTMYVNKGQGLAAIQVGHAFRMFVMRYGSTALILCNPVITRRGREMSTDVEGCLSVPGKRIRIARNKIITVSFQDLYGTTKIIKMRGMDARCAQHEIDHLDGILITEK